MTFLFRSSLCALLLVGSGCKKDEAAVAPVEVATTSVRLKPAQGELAKLISSEVAKARARNLKPFLELRAEWCAPCKDLEKALDEPSMKEAFAGTFIISVDIDEWVDKVAPLGFDGSSIPVFYELDDKARPTGRKIDGGAWEENIPKNMAPPLKAFFAGK